MSGPKKRIRTKSANNGQGRKWIRDEKRLAIYLRDGMSCLWCGEGVEKFGQSSPCNHLTLDHFVSRNANGNNTAANLFTACHRCNSDRKDKSALDYAIEWGEMFQNSQAHRDGLLASIGAARKKDLAPFLAQAKELMRSRGLTKAIRALTPKWLRDEMKEREQS